MAWDYAGEHVPPASGTNTGSTRRREATRECGDPPQDAAAAPVEAHRPEAVAVGSAGGERESEKQEGEETFHGVGDGFLTFQK